MTGSPESATTSATTARVKWQQIHCQTTQANQAQLSDYLETEGAVSITFQDAADQPVFEPLPNETPMWSAIIITALFPIEQDITFVLLGLKALGDDIVQAVKQEQLEEQVWERAWMDDFQPMQFGERVWIYPSQFAVPDDDCIAILLDPGLAFGTGTHPTTALCLTWLDQHPPKQLSVIDYGCGSGILAIAAVKLGAKYVLATDIDEQALLATRDNQQRNQIMAEQIQCYLPEDLPHQTVDVIMANILAAPLLRLAENFAQRLKPSGRLLLSGILETQAEQILATYQPYFSDFHMSKHEGWMSISAQKSA